MVDRLLKGTIQGISSDIPTAQHLQVVQGPGALPGPLKYAKQRPKALKGSPKGRDFTYFWGPGTMSRVLAQVEVGTNPAQEPHLREI